MSLAKTKAQAVEQANNAARLLSIIKDAPIPFDKTDSELAQEYKRWFYGVRTHKLTAAEQKMHPTLGESAASDSKSKPAPKRVI